MQVQRSSKRLRWHWIVLGIALLLLVSFGGRWWVAEKRAEAFAADMSFHGNRADPKTRGPSHGAGTRAAGSKRAVGALPTSGVVAVSALRAQLPLRDQPLLKSAPLLQALANTGNYFAGCRLAVESLYCNEFRRGAGRKVEKLRAALERLPPNDSSRPALLQSIAHAELEAAQQRTHCEGFDATGIEKPWRLLLRASLQGHLASTDLFLMPYWVADDLDSPASAIEALDAFAAYRQYAPGLLAHAAERGWPSATRMLAYEHAGRGLFANVPLLSQFSLAERDPVRAYAFADAHARAEELRSGRVNGLREELGRWSAQMSPAEIERARELSESLVRSWGSEVLQAQTQNESGSKLHRMSDMCTMSY